MENKVITLSSLTIAFIVSAISYYLFSEEIIKFEVLVWIVIGSIFIIGLSAYQELSRRLEDQKIEQTKLDEKLKIYKRLAKIGERFNING